ncbi:MAG: phosphatidate cytidylyltransferase [Paracoccaceae bacterium]
MFFLALLVLVFSVFTLINAGLHDKKILLFIVTVVVITDIFGFVFGRLLGGPKVMPSISPGKTWSGIVFGWFGSALVGFFYTLIFVPGGFGVIAAIFLSIFAQSGDLAESFLKRRAKVKNSSELLPGHGGFLDRFDGMVGASLFYGLVLFWIQ